MLCIIMLMLNAQLFVFAVDEAPPDAENTPDTATPEATLPAETPSENLFELGEGELPYAQLQALSPLDVALPETITRAQAIEKGHVNRLYAQEKTLGAVLYQNQNGTKTAYVFDKPVKYVDADGNIKDKNTTIAATGIAGYAYAMTENSFSAYFGSTASNGVMIQYEDYAFSMKPETSLLVSTPTLGEDARSVIYNGAFGAQTALRYETQLSGVKEDIILMRNVGKYAFNFLLTTSGLTPVQKENGGWTLLNADQETVINFGSIVIKDSAGKTVYGTLNITPRASNGYIMTVTVPQAFLQAADTTYPVYVDPSITTYEASGSWVGIYDTGVYKNQSYYNNAISNPNQHYLHAQYGKVVYKFSDFYATNGEFKELEEYQIGKVTFNVRTNLAINSVKFATSTMTMASSNTGTAIYDTALFNAHSTRYRTNETKTVSAGGILTMDITKIARAWARYNEGSTNENYDNPANGFALSTSSTAVMNLVSYEASGTNNIYYTIDYSSVRGIYYMVNKGASGSLKVNDNRTISYSSGVNYQSSWIVKYEGDGKYLFMPMYHSGYALDSNGAISALPTTITNGYYWTLQMDSNLYEVFKNYSTGKVLCAANGTISVVTERATSASNYSQTAWSMKKYNFGGRGFKEITNATELASITCLSYALNLDDFLRLDYPAECNLSADLSIAKIEYAEISHLTFLHVANVKSISNEYETAFTYNGEYRNISSNQYRIVLRTGLHSSDNGYDGNFHLWYQTNDGRWAHKNGTNEPILLPYGVTPFTENSGGWDLSHHTNYYDSDIYCYIATIS